MNAPGRRPAIDTPAGLIHNPGRKLTVGTCMPPFFCGHYNFGVCAGNFGVSPPIFPRDPPGALPQRAFYPAVIYRYQIPI